MFGRTRRRSLSAARHRGILASGLVELGQGEIRLEMNRGTKRHFTKKRSGPTPDPAVAVAELVSAEVISERRRTGLVVEDAGDRCRFELLCDADHVRAWLPEAGVPPRLDVS